MHAVPDTLHDHGHLGCLTTCMQGQPCLNPPNQTRLLVNYQLSLVVRLSGGTVLSILAHTSLQSEPYLDVVRQPEKVGELCDDRFRCHISTGEDAIAL